MYVKYYMIKSISTSNVKNTYKDVQITINSIEYHLAGLHVNV